MEANRKGKRQKLRHRDNGFYDEQKNYNQGWIEMAWAHEMTRHGGWCGSGWSDNKAQDSVAGYSTAIDALDQTCKEHDLEYYQKGDLKAADDAFAKANVGKGLKRTIYGLGVGVQGKMRGASKSGIYGINNGSFGELPGSSYITPSKGKGPAFGQSPAGKNPTSNVSDGLRRAIFPAVPAALQNTMSGGQGEEVPVMPVPKSISKIHPDYFTIRLPYVFRGAFANGSCIFANTSPLLLLRLNSIYDCMKASNTANIYKNMPYPDLGGGNGVLTAANALNPQATAGISTVQTAAQNPSGVATSGSGGPQGRNIWQAHFKYYRVLRSDVKVTFINKNCDVASTTGDAPDPVSPFRNRYVCGYELVDEDGQLSNNAEMFLMTKNAERAMLAPAQGSGLLVSTPTPSVHVPARPSTTELHYTYVPEAWQYHVEGKGAGETRWTAIGANPALDHLMALRCFHLDEVAQNQNLAPAIGIMVQVEYEVQFMECLDSFYKTQYRSEVTNS